MINEKFVEVKNVVKTFNSGANAVNALDGLSFCIKEGEFVVIVGPSGAGKSTLLNLLGGMDTFTSGDVFIDNKNLKGYSDKKLTLFRRSEIGFVFQFYNLMPNLTAIENVELATEICKDALSPTEVLKKVGLFNRLNNFPSQLSGGEQQRVSIARAIAKNPKILLCDEPTGALDYQTGKSVLKLLYEICKTEKKTVIIVTHNTALKDIADRIIYIKNGIAEKIEENSTPKSVDEVEW